MADDDAPSEGGTGQDTQPDEQGQPTERPTSRKETQQAKDKPAESGSEPGKTFTQAELDQVVADRLARERRKFGDYDDLKKKATEYDKVEDAKKTELEKLNDELTSAQVELQAFKVAETRRKAASEAGLDPELAEYITAVDPDEALAQAKKLAERLKPPEPKTADFRQGSRAPAKASESRDDLIRRMTGHLT